MPQSDDAQLHSLLTWLEGQEEFVFLDCSRKTDDDGSSYLFLEPVTWLCCRSCDNGPAFLEKAERFRQQGYSLAGWFNYEFGYLLEDRLQAWPGREKPTLLAVLGVFRRPSPWPKITDSSAAEDFSVSGLRPSLNRTAFLAALARIREYILAGDTYQVNFTFRLEFDFRGSKAALYRALRRNQSVRYGGWLRFRGRDIMSFSPELFFRVQDGVVDVCPMKGTLRRGRTLAEDQRLRRQLREDGKSRSENVMIVDLLRNDLGRLLHDVGGGRVEPLSLFDVEPYETLLQMTSTIRGTAECKHALSLPPLFSALFPCGSVTGAPKIRTMEIIRELEPDERGVYCGAIGFSGPERTVFNVPIRTLVLEGNTGHMGIGAGIVHDSDPESEWRECLLKGAFLTRFQQEFQLIETLLWQPGRGYLFLDEHLQRLQESAAYFLFAWNEAAIRQCLDTVAVRQGDLPVRVRLLLHKDGRLETSCQELEDSPAPCLAPDCSLAPAGRAGIAARQTDPDDVFLYHKTTNRNLYDTAFRQARDRGLAEIFFCNSRGELTEGSISNIFVLPATGEILLTPPVASGLLAGVLRRFLLENGLAREEILVPEDLQQARAVFMGNAVRGLVRVEMTGDRIAWQPDLPGLAAGAPAKASDSPGQGREEPVETGRKH